MAENRNEELLEAILNAGTVDEVPQSRMEKIWQYALGATIELDIPQSRLESLAILVAEQVRNGGGGITPTGTINITANGTYNVARYANAAVAVPEDHTAEDGLIDRSISGEYANSRVEHVGLYAFTNCKNVTVLSFPKAKLVDQYAFGSGNLATAPSAITTIWLDTVEKIYGHAFHNSGLTALIMSDITVVPLLSYTNAFTGTPIEAGTGYIYVPDNLVNSMKSATNWSTFASQIKPISELPPEYVEPQDPITA